MPIRLTNRFSADRDLGPARVDTNFEDIRRWSGDIDETIAGVSGDIDTINTELSAQFDFANALQSDIIAESVARTAADTTLDDAILAEAATRAADDLTLAAAVTDVSDSLLEHRTGHRNFWVGTYAGPIGDTVIPLEAMSSTQTISSFTELYDPAGMWTGGTQVTPREPGYYQAGMFLSYSEPVATDARVLIRITRNSTIWADDDGVAGVVRPASTIITPPLAFNGTTDSFDFRVFHDHVGARDVSARCWVQFSANLTL